MGKVDAADMQKLVERAGFEIPADCLAATTEAANQLLDMAARLKRVDAEPPALLP